MDWVIFVAIAGGATSVAALRELYLTSCKLRREQRSHEDAKNGLFTKERECESLHHQQRQTAEHLVRCVALMQMVNSGKGRDYTAFSSAVHCGVRHLAEIGALPPRCKRQCGVENEASD